MWAPPILPKLGRWDTKALETAGITQGKRGHDYDVTQTPMSPSPEGILSDQGRKGDIAQEEGITIHNYFMFDLHAFLSFCS